MFPDRPKAGNPCNLLRKPDLSRQPDQKQAKILKDISPVSFKFCRGEEGTEFNHEIEITLRNNSQLIENPGMSYVTADVIGIGGKGGSHHCVQKTQYQG